MDDAYCAWEDCEEEYEYRFQSSGDAGNPERLCPAHYRERLAEDVLVLEDYLEVAKARLLEFDHEMMEAVVHDCRRAMLAKIREN